eukprot:2868584-Amphidinium_carterae.2
MTLDAKREVAWMIMTVNKMANNALTPLLMAKSENNGNPLTDEQFLDKLNDFELQHKSKRQEARKTRMFDLVDKYLKAGHAPDSEDLSYKVTASTETPEFLEQLVAWLHVIGKIIVPALQDIGLARTSDTDKLTHLIRYLYEVMGTEHMKDLSHVGAMAQYGDEVNSSEAGAEKIHVVDYGNSLYGELIDEGCFIEFIELTTGWTTEHKGDIIESLMGLNFLEKEGRIDCSALGIRSLEDAAETLLRAEWLGFQKGLEWSLAYMSGHSILSAIVALREVCSSYEWQITDDGGLLVPKTGKRCLICGKSKNRVAVQSCYPRLMEALMSHVEYDPPNSCVHAFSKGVYDRQGFNFDDYVNKERVIRRWWTQKERAFVVYISENRHRQWPVGGYWDLEIMACAMMDVFQKLLPRLVDGMKNAEIHVFPTNEDTPVIPTHLAALLDPQVPWWEGCDFPISQDEQLVD